MAKTYLPGSNTWYAVDSPASEYSAFFEDDGETGYFYAYDLAAQESLILDAVHIYNVKNISDRDIESKVEIIWSADGLKTALLLNGYPHAVIDFSNRCSYCRTGFPAPSDNWARGPWKENLMDFFSVEE